eukprot:TRINITY_DN37882_c0_g1_i1.p1 TRINITY_DN37882_c0_g1~~TRINITY_DN37882_c0_g1_i1.p1  ORF type:complete len:269 (-),score=26.85 TRINITY_DN37882_c0_g1_i1:61-762(-)
MGVECFECGGEHFERDCPKKAKSKGSGKADKGKSKSKGKGKGAEVRTSKTGGKGPNKGNGWRPDAPVDTPGRWVELCDFEGKKSFAFFRCQCGKSWTTAHGYPQFRQDCNKCENPCRPKFMWQNDKNDRSAGFDSQEKNRRSQDDAPHDSSRCEACRAGVCSLSQPHDSLPRTGPATPGESVLLLANYGALDSVPRQDGRHSSSRNNFAIQDPRFQELSLQNGCFRVCPCVMM